MLSGGPDGIGGSALARLSGPLGRRGRSGGAKRERVEVVGKDRPGGPGTRAGVALQARAVEAVAALEAADAPFGADAGRRQSAVGLAGVWGVLARDEQPVGPGQVVAHGAVSEAAVEP